MTRVPFTRRRIRLWLQPLEARDLPAFVIAPSYGVESSSTSTAIADFNGDGAGDVAVAHLQTNGKISVLISNGNGFAPPVVYPATGSTRDVIAADFTGDDILDLATVGSTSASNLAIFRGNGDGTIAPAQMYKASAVGSLALVAADFNNDGDLDVATVTTAATVTIVLNEGGGVFGDPQGFVATTHLNDLAAGDLNGDGNADVLAVGFYCDPPPFVACFPKIHVFLGNGAGSLTLGPTYLDSNPSAVVLDDFDQDQDLDFAIVSSDAYVPSHAVSVWLGNGDGTFALNQKYDDVEVSRELAAGDLDGDGKIYLVVGNYDATTVTVLKGTGDGTFELVLGYALTGYPSSIAVGDLNGDFDLDLVMTLGANITVLRNKGAGNFEAVAIYPLGEHPYSVANADFNGDGMVDLAVSEGNGGIDWVNVFIGLGDGTFNPAGTYAVGNSPVAIAVGDFDRDGDRDLVTADRYSNQVSVLRNKGDGTFFPAIKYAAGPEPTGVIVADFTGDGFQDLVVTNFRNPGTISFLRGTPSGRYRSPVSYPAARYPTAITYGDFDGDGKLDLAVAAADTGNAVLILRGNGNGSFQPPITELIPTTYQLSSILTRDFNADGKLDLAITAEYPSSTQTPSVFILLGNGDSTFQPAVGYVVRNNCSSLAAADFDGNGTLDLVVGVGNSFSHTLALMRGTGDGTFTEPSFSPLTDYYPVGPYVQGLTTADFNSDGAPDVAAALGAYSGFPGVSIVLNSNDRSNSGHGNEWTPLPTADLHVSGSIVQPRLEPSSASAPQSQAEVTAGEDLIPPLPMGNGALSRVRAIKRLSDANWMSPVADPLFAGWTA